MIPQVAGNPVILMDKDNIEQALITVTKHPLILPALGGFRPFAADCLISVYLDDQESM